MCANTMPCSTDLYNQAVYWIWSMAEPNVTIISASIPVLRGFVRNVRKRTESSPGAGAYLKTGDNSGRFYNRSVVTTVRADPKDQDAASDSSILDRSNNNGDINNGGGITWTTEISVEYEPRPSDGKQGTSASSKKPSNAVEFEMDRMDHSGRPVARSD